MITVSARARDAILASAVAAASLVLFVLTLQPDFGGPEDTPKFQFIGHVLGIPHPPGYPLYVLLSHAFVRLPISTIAYRANLFSAVMAAAACALAYAIGRQLGVRPWPACCAALGLATGASFWRSAVFAEVYSLAAVMAGLTIALLLGWGRRGGAHLLVAAFGAFAVGLGNHLTIVGLVPAFAVFVLTRGRPVWTFRIVAASALLLALGIGQYALIVARTRQGAPYLETRAETARDLVGVVAAERFADQRFAFGPRVLLTDHLPATAGLIGRELGVVGTILFVVGALTAFTRADLALVLGAAAGMLVMSLNLSGDLKGFITPVMVLLWPCAAAGVEVLARKADTIRGQGSAVMTMVLALAAVPAVTNLSVNYTSADASRQAEPARFLRSLFSQLPEGAGFVAEDYWSDMAWHYYRFTGEAGPDRRIARVNFDEANVRRAAREGRRVFAFAVSATYLASEGLWFKRALVEGPRLNDWLARLPRGSIIVGATTYAPFAGNLSILGHAKARPPAQSRPFEAFAFVAGRPGSAWRMGEDRVSLDVGSASLAAPLPAFAGALVATAGADGARVDLDGHAVARTGRGAALAAFAPDGTFVRGFELSPDRTDGVPYAEALYELAGESACRTLRTDSWTDIDPVVAGGSWVSTLHDAGTVVIETAAPALRDARARSTVLMGEGRMKTSIDHGPDGDVMTTEMSRAGESRVMFRLAFDRSPAGARARLRPPGARSAVRICALHAAGPLIAPGSTEGVLKPDFESEPYFGAGWSDVRRTTTGQPVRQGADGATLFLPLEPGRDYRLLLDAAADNGGEMDVTLNGAPVGACTRACEIRLPSAAIRPGTNTLMLRRQTFMFRGARILVD